MDGTADLEEVGDVGEMVRGTYEATLVNEMEDFELGPTWTLTNGTFEFVLQPPR